MMPTQAGQPALVQVGNWPSLILNARDGDVMSKYIKYTTPIKSEDCGPVVPRDTVPTIPDRRRYRLHEALRPGVRLEPEGRTMNASRALELAEAVAAQIVRDYEGLPIGEANHEIMTEQLEARIERSLMSFWHHEPEVELVEPQPIGDAPLPTKEEVKELEAKLKLMKDFWQRWQVEQ